MNESFEVLPPPTKLKSTITVSHAAHRRRITLNGISRQSRDAQIETLRRRPFEAAPAVRGTRLTGSQGKIRRALEEFVSFEPLEYRLKVEALSTLSDKITMGQFSWAELQDFVERVTVVELENIVETVSVVYYGDWENRNDFVDDILMVIATIVSIETPDPLEQDQPVPYAIGDELTKKLYGTSLCNLLLAMIGENSVNIHIDVANTVFTLIGNMCWVKAVRDSFVENANAIETICAYITRNRQYPDTAVWVLSILMTESLNFRPDWLEPIDRILPDLFNDVYVYSDQDGHPHPGIASDLFKLTENFFTHPAIVTKDKFTVEAINQIKGTSVHLDENCRTAFARLFARLSEINGTYVYLMAHSEIVDYIELRVQITLRPKEAVYIFRFLYNFLLGMTSPTGIQPNKLFPSFFVKNFLFDALIEMQTEVWEEALFLWFIMIQCCSIPEELQDLFEYEHGFHGADMLNRALMYPNADVKARAIDAFAHAFNLCNETAYRSGQPGWTLIIRFCSQAALQERFAILYESFEHPLLSRILDHFDHLEARRDRLEYMDTEETPNYASSQTTYYEDEF